MSDALDDGDDIKEAEFLDGGVSLEEECERLTDSAGSLHARDGWSACRGWGRCGVGWRRLGVRERAVRTPRTAALTMIFACVCERDCRRESNRPRGSSRSRGEREREWGASQWPRPSYSRGCLASGQFLTKRVRAVQRVQEKKQTERDKVRRRGSGSSRN